MGASKTSKPRRCRFRVIAVACRDFVGEHASFTTEKLAREFCAQFMARKAPRHALHSSIIGAPTTPYVLLEDHAHGCLRVVAKWEGDQAGQWVARAA